MKCKRCGGELLFRDGIYCCKNCGTTSTLDNIYENIDVCICYEENDAAGRRTRDSIIAQEVYRKFKENKVATFYERISADGMTGDDLEAGKLAAIHKTKIVIVLGTTVESFTTIEAKYGEYFAGKPVIPFCVDVNPGAIPKTLSKIQAMSYSTIGWDKDLIKGVYNILGREQDVDTGSLYSRRKAKIIVVSIIAAVVAIAVTVAAWILLKPDDVDRDSDVGISSTEETTEITNKPLTQKEIYDNATELLNQGNFVEALELFAQIPDHPNSANMIEQIYSKYEGYYQNQTTTIHLNVTNNISANVEMRITSEVGVTTITATAQIVGPDISCTYVDNHKSAGNLELKLENMGLRVIQQQDGAEKVELFFAFSQKTDQPIVQIDSNALLTWLDQLTTYKQVKSYGYSLVNESNDSFGMGLGTRYCRIRDTDIYLAFLVENYDDEVSDEDFFLHAIEAPATLIAPFLVGKADAPAWDNNRLYWPQYKDELYSPNGIGDKIVNETTFVSVRNLRDENEWHSIVEQVLSSKAECLLREKFQLSADSYVNRDTVGENDTHYLFSLRTGSMRISDTCAWYKANKSDQTVTYVREGPYYETLIEEGKFGEDGYFSGLKISKTLWFSEYADFAEEFPGVFG